MKMILRELGKEPQSLKRLASLLDMLLEEWPSGKELPREFVEYEAAIDAVRALEETVVH